MCKILTVVLLVCLAVHAGKIGSDLSSYTDPVANLDGSDFASDLDGLSNNFVSDTDWKRNLAPPT